MDRLVEMFCDVDDFCKSFVPGWKKQLLSAGAIQRQRDRGLSLSEIMMILIHFHQLHYRAFKAYWLSSCCVRICVDPALGIAPAFRL